MSFSISLLCFSCTLKDLRLASAASKASLPARLFSRISRAISASLTRFSWSVIFPSPSRMRFSSTWISDFAVSAVFSCPSSLASCFSVSVKDFFLFDKTFCCALTSVIKPVNSFFRPGRAAICSCLPSIATFSTSILLLTDANRVLVPLYVFRQASIPSISSKASWRLVGCLITKGPRNSF